MKIICLNTWGGTAGVSELVNFLSANAGADVFCLQEIVKGGENESFKRSGVEIALEYKLFDRINESLPNHTGYFSAGFKHFFGLAIFVKNNIEILEEGERFVHKHKGFITDEAGDQARLLQYIKIKHKGDELCVINFHGLWNGQGKTDTGDRIQQTKNILDFTKTISTDFVLCGDFNLLPDTQSIKMIEDSGLRNLIKEYGITSTRTSHYNKPIKFADYAFVTKGIEVKDFRVMPEEVSDHAPLYLEVA